MKSLFLILFALLMLSSISNSKPGTMEDEFTIRRIFDLALTEGYCYENLRSLCFEVGPRLSGSLGAAKAVDWAYDRLKALGSDTVFLQEMMVPNWKRGNVEKCLLHLPGKTKPEQLAICALGGSVGTNGELKAKVIEVKSIEELKSLGSMALQGRIVFFNRPMDPKHIDTFHAYGGCVDQRTTGASEAAPFGAIAVLVRSMNLRDDDLPHTGVQVYKEGVAKIPAVAISTNAADKLSRLLKEFPGLEISLELSCKTMPDTISHNVIGEIRGSKYPDEIILIGAHLDSWDTGQGAHDDGAGVVHCLEVFYLLKKMNIQPQRTIRCVLFMNEENGSRGAIKYAEEAKRKGEKHLVAIESDRGGFTPRGFTVDGMEPQKNQTMQALERWANLLKPYDLHKFEYGFSGVDVNYLKDQQVALLGFVPDPQRYFDYHHAPNDNFDAVNKRELELGAASITTLVYLFDKYGLMYPPLPTKLD